MKTLSVLLVGVSLWVAAFGATGGVVSERTYKVLERVHELMDAGKYDQALQRLEKLRPSKRRSYEQALLLQTYGYLYAAKDEYGRAADAFARCLALKKLPAPAARSTLYALAQSRMAAGDYRAAIASFEQWFAREKAPTARAHALAGEAYAQEKRYARAIDHLQQAIAATGDVNEDWYRRLLAVYYDAGRYRDAARLLERMIERFPGRKIYWLQLSGIFRTLQDDARSLAVLELAHRNGLLSDERELVDLASFYRYMDMPYKAAQLLDRALRDGALATTAAHLRLLSDAWWGAREPRRALDALQRAAKLGQDPALYVRCTRIASEVDDWPAVIDAANSSLRIGGLQHPGEVYLMLGMAHYQRQDLPAARKAFQRATAYEKVRKQARQWLDLLAQETALAEAPSN